MKNQLTTVAYTFAAMASLFFFSGIGILAGKGKV